jgi:hypothetical protein
LHKLGSAAMVRDFKISIGEEGSGFGGLRQELITLAL